jgi:probable HAF family extracellular repeat protein
LGTLGGIYSYAYGVNASGRVAGSSLITGNSFTHAFLSAANGGALVDLGTLSGGTNSYAFGVNSKGQVVGYSDNPSGYNHAFISDANGGTLYDLGTLGREASFAVAVNDSAQVTGRSDNSGIGPHAFVSDANGGALHDLGTLGGSSSYGEGINSAGSVCGYSYLSDNSTQHAFLYKPTTGLVDLNTLLANTGGWVLVDAKGINDSGQIAGFGSINSYMHAFLLTPILPVVKITAIIKERSGYVLVKGIGVANKRHSVYVSSSLTSQFTYLGAITALNDGTIQFEDTSVGASGERFYRLTYP